jgi:hypothetical protein
MRGERESTVEKNVRFCCHPEYAACIYYGVGSLQGGFAQMKIVETAEMAPTCHAGYKLVETAEVAPTCHNFSLVETTEVAPTCH